MDREKTTRKVGLLGLIANLGLAAIKLAAGMLSGSSAMTADGFNSAGDVFSSAMTLLGNHIAMAPKDEDHPYGHGKAEYIFSAVIGTALLLVAWNTLQSSAQSLLSPSPVGHVPLLLLVASITIAVKTLLAIYCGRAGKRMRNPLVLANAEDHKADIFVTTGTVLGILGNQVGLRWLDGAVGIIVSAWIGLQGARILREAYIVLMDTTSKQCRPILEQARAIVEQESEVDHLDSVRARPVGNRFSVVVKISVPGNMTVHDSHHITLRIKEALMKNPDVADVVIHVNPMEEHTGPSRD